MPCLKKLRIAVMPHIFEAHLLDGLSPGVILWMVGPHLELNPGSTAWPIHEGQLVLPVVMVTTL